MITLSSSATRSTCKPLRGFRPSVLSTARPFSRRQQLQRRIAVAAAPGSDEPLRFDDRGLPDNASGLADSLKDQQV